MTSALSSFLTAALYAISLELGAIIEMLPWCAWRVYIHAGPNHLMEDHATLS